MTERMEPRVDMTFLMEGTLFERKPLSRSMWMAQAFDMIDGRQPWALGDTPAAATARLGHYLDLLAKDPTWTPGRRVRSADRRDGSRV